MANDTTVFRSLVEQIQQRDRDTGVEPVRGPRQRRDARREEPVPLRAEPASTKQPVGLLSRRWL